MKRIFSILIFSLLALCTHATHNRAGEIIFERVNGENPFLYQITVITYTKFNYPPGSGGQANEADRCEVTVNFGDGTSSVVSRSNFGAGPNQCDAGVGNGSQVGNDDIKKNEYTIQHEFPGAGTYTVSMEDPNRNQDIQNIPNSVQVPFYIQSSITMDQVSGGNNAPILQNPPIDEGCVNVPFEHNPGAVDPDGDSLVYSIVRCRGAAGEIISGYQFPNQIGDPNGNNLTINTRTGDLIWNSPKSRGEFNICIQIDEYRKNTSNGNIIRVGSIIRDMQITIATCAKDPPDIDRLDRRCVTAGTRLLQNVRVTDPQNDRLIVSATGFPFEASNRATLNGSFTGNDGQVAIPGPPPFNLEFSWQTTCADIQQQPYWVYFKAKQDVTNNSVELVDFETFEILVVAPPVEISSITPEGKKLIVSWSRANCNQADGYDVYRYIDSTGYEAAECVTGVPEPLGYQLVGSTNSIDVTTFADDNGGEGLVHGQEYCYMIVTRYPDGSESYPSLERCGELIRDVPILNKVSVVETDSVNGSDSIAWYKPIELRTDLFGPPYSYRLYRSSTNSPDYVEIFTSPEVNDFLTLDTIYFDTLLNTLQEQFFYKVELLSNGTANAESRAASSIFLSSTPRDNQLDLFWEVNVPWTNDEYVVYRFSNHTDSLDSFNVLDTVTGLNYSDMNLANNREYRYFVMSIGGYSSEELPKTLFNKSQIHTGIPMDLEAPCPPSNATIDGECDAELTEIFWDNPNLACENTDDVVSYNVYFANQLGKKLELLTTIEDPNITSYRHFKEGSIAGCYAITAIDSFDNESDFSQSLCIDNCPNYELPNVFTPTGDNLNDVFEPFPYKFVESISIQIFNRWGELVFETTDPDINWDGTRQKTGKELPSGVYYYDCQVNEIRLIGIVSRTIRSHVTLFRDSDPQQQAP